MYPNFIANREALILKGYLTEEDGGKAMRLTEKGHQVAQEKFTALSEEDALLFVVYINAISQHYRKMLGNE